MKNGAGITQLSQAVEYAPQYITGERFSYCLAYARATETQTTDSLGQDYLTLCEDGETFTFVLCDGVSQSFYGDLAAKYLGDALLTWLRDLPDALEDTVDFRTALRDTLQALTVTGTRQVQQLSLPSDLPGMLREVLEEKRSLGSEAMFVCGRIDLPNSELPRGRALLAWMGDARLRVWGETRELKLPGEFKTEQRWSTRRGPVMSEPHVYAVPLHDGETAITRLMAYSDGLTDLDTWDTLPSDAELSALIAQAKASPLSDDIAFLGLYLTTYHKSPKAPSASIRSLQTQIATENQAYAPEPESSPTLTDKLLPPSPPPEPKPSTREDTARIQVPSPPLPVALTSTRKPSKTTASKRQFWGIGAALLTFVCLIGIGLTWLPEATWYPSLFGKSSPPLHPDSPVLTLTEETVPASPVMVTPTTKSVPIATYTTTPTPDPTATRTVTPSPSPMPTPTPTPTPTLTAIPTATPTSSPTPVIAVTPTLTVTITPVLSPTLTATPATILHTPTPTVSLTLVPPE